MRLFLSYRTLLGLGIFCLGWPCAAESLEGEKVAFFESKIRPVLVEKCYSCHSAEAKGKGKLKGGLYLDSRAGILAGGESGPAIVVGRPAESLVVQAIRHASSDLAMPPKGDQLSEAV